MIRIVGLPDLESNRPGVAPAPVLAMHVEPRLRGEGNAPILPLLRRAAVSLAETQNLWARECPGLLPCEVSAIVHWACLDIQRANELIDDIVSWRDSAMRRSQVPDPDAAPGVNAQLHAEKVAEFYGEHPWLGRNASMSLAAEVAFCKLLVYCDLLLEAK